MLVALTPSSASTVTVQYAVSGGTASNGVDYNLSPGVITFLPGSTSEVITIGILNDSEKEFDETLDLSLSYPTNATLSSPTSHTYTIQANDYLKKGFVRGVSDEWKIVELGQSYTSMVVVCTPNYDSNNVPMVVRTKGVFQQDSSGTNHGLIIIEAENFDGHTPRSDHSWIPNFTNGYSGNGAMEAYPNDDLTLNAAYAETSPELEYSVYFSHTGMHYVWVRGRADAGVDDSCHIGLDDQEVLTADRIDDFTPRGSWVWENGSMDGDTIRINIPTPGYHKVSLWMRQDGLVVDKIILTTNASYTPTGMGPDESIREYNGDSFSVRAQSPGGNSDTNVTVNYLVVEEGTYAASGSEIQMEAYAVDSLTTDSSSSFVGQAISYSNAYANPVVLGQVMTFNDTNWSVFWSADNTSPTNAPSSSGLVIGKHVGEDSSTLRLTERIAYIVMESGTGTLDGMTALAAVGPSSVVGYDGDGIGGTAPTSYDLSWTSGTPMAIAAQAGVINTNEGSWTMLYGEVPVTPNTMDLATDEDELLDAERVNTGERVGYVILERPAIVGYEASFSSGPPSQTNVQIIVSLSAASAETVTVDYAVTEGTASGPPTTNETRVAADTDDVEEFLTDGSVDASGNNLEIGEAGVPQLIGVRFTSMPILPGSIIESAYVQFTASAANLTGEVANLWIMGEDADNATTYSGGPYSISTRPRTDATVTWSPPAWTNVGDAGLDQRTPDLSTIIQEIIDRPGWSNDAAISLVVTGNGTRRARTFDASETEAALLHVEFRANTEADYHLNADTLVFAPGETSKTINITILNGTTREDSESIGVTLSDPVNAELGSHTFHMYIIDAYEVDDTSAQASVFPVGGTQLHTFHVTNDVDWFKFFAVTDYTYVIETTNVDLTIDNTIDVYQERPDGSLTNITTFNDVGLGEGERKEIDFPNEAMCHTRVSRSSGSGDQAGKYTAKVDAKNQGGVFFVIGYNEVTRGPLPTGATATLDGVVSAGFNGKTAIGFPGVSDGIHTVEVTFSQTGFLALEDPDFPNQLTNQNNIMYGNPRRMVVDLNGSTLAGYAAFSYVPTVEATATVRDRWTHRRLDNVDILFQATSGHIMSNHVLDGHAYYSNYKSNWLTHTSGDFPTNVILPATNAHLVLTRAGFDAITLTNAVFNIQAGDQLDLGTIYIRPTDTNANGIADTWETNHFGPGANIDPDDDPDTDGFDNLYEYKLGTQPTNGSDALMIKALDCEADGIAVTWEPVAEGRMYRASYADDFNQQTWTPSPAGLQEGTNGQTQMQWTDTATTGESNRCYRIDVIFPSP